MQLLQYQKLMNNNLFCFSKVPIVVIIIFYIFHIKVVSFSFLFFDTFKNFRNLMRIEIIGYFKKVIK